MLAPLALASSLAAGMPAPASGQGVYAFEHVSVIPMDAEWSVLDDYTVVVRDGVVAVVGRSGEVGVPEGAVRIDGRGRWLMPGLAEMHAHVPPMPQGSAEWPDREALQDILFLYLANGITTIRGMLGADYQLELAEAIERGEVLGPSFYVGAFSLNGNSAPDPEAAERLVRAHAEKGYDFQKIHPGFSRETWDRAVEVAREVDLPLAGHVPADVGLEHALESGIMASVDHLDGYVEAAASTDVRARMAGGESVPLGEQVVSATEARIRELARLTRERGTAVVPTMYLWENLYGGYDDVDSMLGLPEMRYVSAGQREAWRNQAARRPALDPEVLTAFLGLRRRILGILEDEGVEVLMGTDSPQLFNVPGFALHRELRVMRESGLTNWAILETGTANVGEWVREWIDPGAAFGVVAPGQRADLVLLEKNPLADLANLTTRVGVMVRGRWFPAADLDAGLERIAAKHGG